MICWVVKRGHLDKQSEKRITAFEMKYYRKILNTSRVEHRRNKSIRDELKVDD